jgi:hypothetical protein
LYPSPNIIRIIESRKMRLSGYTARTREEKNAHRMLVGKPEGKTPPGRPMCRC